MFNMTKSCLNCENEDRCETFPESLVCDEWVEEIGRKEGEPDGRLS